MIYRENSIFSHRYFELREPIDICFILKAGDRRGGVKKTPQSPWGIPFTLSLPLIYWTYFLYSTACYFKWYLIFIHQCLFLYFQGPTCTAIGSTDAAGNVPNIASEVGSYCAFFKIIFVKTFPLTDIRLKIWLVNSTRPIFPVGGNLARCPPSAESAKLAKQGQWVRSRCAILSRNNNKGSFLFHGKKWE